jgi:hypothetical protein
MPFFGLSPNSLSGPNAIWAFINQHVAIGYYRGGSHLPNALQRKGFWVITLLFITVVLCLLSYAIWMG